MNNLQLHTFALEDLISVWDLPVSTEPVVEGMIARASVTLISAASGTGKSLLAYAVAGAVAHGRPFIGLPVEQMPVLYVDGENPAANVKTRIEALGIPKTDQLIVWGIWETKNPPIGPSHPEVIRFACERKGLLIFDSLVQFHPGD